MITPILSPVICHLLLPNKVCGKEKFMTWARDVYSMPNKLDFSAGVIFCSFMVLGGEIQTSAVNLSDEKLLQGMFKPLSQD